MIQRITMLEGETRTFITTKITTNFQLLELPLHN